MKFYLLLIILLVSCTRSQDLLKLNPEKFPESVCLSSEGKGRFKIDKSSYPFDFQTGFDGSIWVLAADIPLHGEEVIEIKDIDGRGYYWGSFYGRILKSMRELVTKNENYKFYELKKFFKGFKHYVQMFHSKSFKADLIKNCLAKWKVGSVCKRVFRKTTYHFQVTPENFLVHMVISKDSSLYIKHWDFAQGLFKRVQLSFEKKHGESNGLVKMNLNHFNCTKS